jgi:hypothetical protein
MLDNLVQMKVENLYEVIDIFFALEGAGRFMPGRLRLRLKARPNPAT